MALPFKKQTNRQIILETGIDLTSATVIKILFIKPNLTKGTWGASLSGTTKMVFNATSGEVDMAGWWQFQSYAVIGGLTNYGEVVRQYFESPLD